jgi:hypothetical protein
MPGRGRRHHVHLRGARLRRLLRDGHDEGGQAGARTPCCCRRISTATATTRASSRPRSPRSRR